jgi:Transcription factor WhiB
MTRYTTGGVAVPVSSVWSVVAPPGRWTAEAECRRHADDAEYFTEASTFEEADLALSVCADCPVRAACLSYGQELRADGVWGGRLLHHGNIQRRFPRRSRAQSGADEGVEAAAS